MYIKIDLKKKSPSYDQFIININCWYQIDGMAIVYNTPCFTMLPTFALFCFAHCSSNYSYSPFTLLHLAQVCLFALVVLLFSINLLESYFTSNFDAPLFA